MTKRILSIVLCLCLLASSVVLFASCGNKQIELVGYRVVYASDVSNSMVGDVQSFVQTLKTKTDSSITLTKVKPDDELSGEEEFEILIGNTNRAESQKALSKIKGHGYSISVMGSKIVIVGTSNLMTAVAMDYFVDTYLSGEGTVSAVTLPSTYKNEEMETVNMDAGWSFVYSALLDGERDYPNLAIQDLKGVLSDMSSVRGMGMPAIADTEKAKNEILVGDVARDEAVLFASGMSPYSYGVGVKDGKILVSALNDTMLAKAFALFKDVLQDSVAEVDGKKIFVLPKELARIYTDTESAKTPVDFPLPEGLELDGSVDVHEGMEYYYSGKDVSVDAYNAYCNALTAAGYTLYSGNSVDSSIFRIYNNKTENVTLYVAYDAFKYAEEKGITIHEPAIRIVASYLNAVKQMKTEELSADFSYEKLQNSSITSVKYNAASVADKTTYGNIYIVTLEDGSFVVMDGGQSTSSDATNLYNILVSLYKKGHGGEEPSTSDPIRIAAWYVSHGHADHYSLMEKLINVYCKNYNSKCITIDRLIANFGSDEEHANSEKNNEVGSFNATVRDNYAKYSASLKDAPGKEPGMEYIKVHTGQKFWIANVEFEVLYTHEDLYPNRLHTYNNSSTVIRMNMYHTENGAISEGAKTSMLWLGDAQTAASQTLRARYSDKTLKSDMVQVAHHTFDGCELALYKMISPTCVWWPTTIEQYKNSCFNANAKPGATTHVNYNINYGISSIKYIVLAAVCNYTVTITATGADYSIGGATGIYSANEPNSTVSMGSVSDKTGTGLMKTKYAG